MTKIILKNVTIGLAVSFVAISLGASLGILSGRGAFAGMISAGLIAIVTSLMGGTRIQCSGPTAPMSAISALVIAYTLEHYTEAQNISGDQFITLTFVMTGLMLILMSFLRLGRLIAFIPNVVVSGFMSGIALLIWSGQIKVLFGLHDQPALEGPLYINLAITTGTIIIIFLVPRIIKRFAPKLASYIPSTLIAIIVMSLFAWILQLPVAYTILNSSIDSAEDIKQLVLAQWPGSANAHDVLLAAPFALKLAVLCFLDTLLTSLVIDRMTKEKTRQNKELAAQGAGNIVAALFGGIPGAQATIRSVLMIQEGATLRLAGVLVGVFVLIELFLFSNVFSYIPAAVFVGILMKVGYDVFDRLPLEIYALGMINKVRSPARQRPALHMTDTHKKIAVSHGEMIMIFGTMLVTLLIDLNIAVVGFTLIFYVLNRTSFNKDPLPDLQPPAETEGVSDEP